MTSSRGQCSEMRGEAPQVAVPDRGPDGAARAARDVAGQHALAGALADVGVEQVLGDPAVEPDLGRHRSQPPCGWRPGRRAPRGAACRPRWCCTLWAPPSASTPGCTVAIRSRGSPTFSTLRFYPAIFGAVVYLIRASAVRVRWMQLALDAMILVVGFGAFFWFLVIRPAGTGSEINVIKNVLSQTYLALNCILLLTLGVLLLAGCRASRRLGGCRCYY